MVYCCSFIAIHAYQDAADEEEEDEDEDEEEEEGGDRRHHVRDDINAAVARSLAPSGRVRVVRQY